MKKNLISVMLCLFITTVFGLTGCGGGGGGYVAPPIDTVSGIVSVADKVLSGMVYLTDSSIPSKERFIAIAADGSYSIDVTGLTKPYLFKAYGAANGEYYTLYAAAADKGITNINESTKLDIVNTLPENNPKGTVKGSVYAPNGIDPISEADVFVPTIITAKSVGSAFVDYALSKSSYKTKTSADGTFILEIPSGQQKLVIQKGLFKLIIPVFVPVNSTLEIPKAATTLSAISSTDGTMKTPKIAVLKGSWDRMENVLAKLGLGQVDAYGTLIAGTETFTLIDGEDTANVDALLGNSAELAKYELIVFNCGVSGPTNILHATSNIRSYVENGGRIYVTDLSYDFVEKAFPEFILWEGELAGNPTIAAPTGIAMVGQPNITTNATIIDTKLKAWLQTVKSGNSANVTNSLPSLNADGTIHIEDFLDGWAVMSGRHTTGAGAMGAVVSTYIEGNVYWNLTSGVRPLTVSFPVGANGGKVTYTSYHSDFAPHLYLLPQERMLQYLIFEQ